MKFRTSFVSITNDYPNPSSGSGLCSQSVDTTLSMGNNLSLLVKVAGVTIVNTTNYSTFTTATVAVPGIGNVIATLFSNGLVSGLELYIPLANTWDSTTVEIIASKANYLTYTNSFVVYGYDLGNDTGGGITTNPDMDIVMRYDYTGSGVPQIGGYSYSKFVAYRKPFTDLVYYYNLTSNPSDTQYEYTNTDTGDVLLNYNSNGFVCSKEEIDISFKVSYGRPMNAPLIYDDICTSNLIIAEYDAFKLPFSVQTTCPTCPSTDCYLINQGIDVLTLFNNTPTYQYFTVDDIQNTPPYISLDIQHELYDYFGNLIQTDTQTVSVTYPYIPDPNGYPFSGLTLTDFGIYYLRTTVKVAGLYECTLTTVLKGCGSFKTTRNDCSEFTFTNTSSSSEVLEVYKITSNTSIQTSDNTLVLNQLVPSGGEIVQTLEDGLYMFLYDGKVTFNTVSCQLEACLADYTKAVICGEAKDCGCGGSCGCDKRDNMTYNLNSIMAIAYSYFSILQSNYYFSQVFDTTVFNNNSISQHKDDISDMFTINQLLDKVKYYCRACNMGLKTPCKTATISVSYNNYLSNANKCTSCG